MKNKKWLVIGVLYVGVCAMISGCGGIGKVEKHLLVKDSKYNGNGELEGWSEFVYDENGNKVEWKIYDENELSYWSEFAYGENGNIIDCKRYYADGELFSEEIYNENGERISSVDFSEGKEDRKSLCTYDQNGNCIKTESYWTDKEGELKLSYVYEYTYDENDMKIKKKTSSYDVESGTAEYSKECDYTYDEDGNILSEYSYDIEISEKQLSGWTNYLYNTQGDVIEEQSYAQDGSVSYIERYEYDYDGKGNNIRYRCLDDSNGWVWDDVERKYDENGNLIEEIFYDENGNIESRYVKEYETIQVDKQDSDEKDEPKTVVSISDEEKLEFMKKLYDSMKNKAYESVSVLIEDRNTMWTTIYYQNGQLVDKLSDGEALIYSYGSGVYYGEVLNGKRQGKGVQWKEDRKWAKDGQVPYYYIDGIWRDNKGNGHCLAYYSAYFSGEEIGNHYAYIEGEYLDSMENGEMCMTWLGTNGEVCTGTYEAVEGVLQNKGEPDGQGRYVLVEDENGSGNYVTTGLLDGKGFPRNAYEEMK